MGNVLSQPLGFIHDPSRWARANRRSQSTTGLYPISDIDEDQHSDENALAPLTVAGTACLAYIGCYALRLMMRDVIETTFPQASLSLRAATSAAGIASSNPVLARARALQATETLKVRRDVFEMYGLSLAHSSLWAVFSGYRILANAPTAPRGVTRMLSASLGFYLYQIVQLQDAWFTDPLMFIHSLCNMAGIYSTLRSSRVNWSVPVLHLTEHASDIPLNVLRLMWELQIPHHHLVHRVASLIFAASFSVSKLLLLPSFLYTFVFSPSSAHHEFHQPAYLGKKLSLLLDLSLNWFWGIGLMRTLFLPSARRRLSAQATTGTTLLPLRLLGGTLDALSRSYNPLALSFFLIPIAAPLGAPLATVYAALVMQAGTIRNAVLAGALGSLAASYAAPMPKVGNTAYLDFIAPFTRAMRSYFSFRVVIDGPTYKLAGRDVHLPSQISPRSDSNWVTFDGWSWSGVSHSLKSRTDPGDDRSLTSIARNATQHNLRLDGLDKDKRYLLATFPHGIMPWGQLCLTSSLFEAQRVVATYLGASVLFQIPFLRNLLSLMGAVPATARNLKTSLHRPYPNNMSVIVPGGIAEMFLCRSDIEHIFIKRRKGFVRSALQTGTDIIPCYLLGQTQTHTVAWNAFTRWCMDVSRRIRMSLVPFSGRGGFMSPVPHSQPIIALVGEPIRVPKTDGQVERDDVSDEEVEYFHAEFVRRLASLFHRHKHLLPDYAHKQLYFDDDEVPETRPGMSGYTAFPQMPHIPEEDKGAVGNSKQRQHQRRRGGGSAQDAPLSVAAAARPAAEQLQEAPRGTSRL